MFFRGRSKRRRQQSSAVADPDALFAEIEQLTESNRAERSPARDRELRRLRHLAGIALVETASGRPSYVEPAAEPPARNPESKLAEIEPDELTPGLLRAVLAVLHPLGLSQYGPEQVDFLRYRPVLDNRRLKEVFGYVPKLTSAEVFELFRRSHGLGPR